MSSVDDNPIPTPGDAARSPWLAFVLSLFATGVGHVYCGRIVRGLVLFAVWLLLLPTAMLAARLEPSTAVLIVLIVLPAVAVTVVYIGACFDAWRLARRVGTDPGRRDYNNGFVYAVLLVIGITYPLLVMSAIRSQVFEGFLIAESSMSPTLVAGDRVLANKVFGQGGGRRPANLSRFDVIVFESPERPNAQWVKRLVGLPGDSVEILSGALLVNDVPVLWPGSAAPGSGVNMPQVTVSDGSVFVLGDSLECSMDSRHFGAVPLADVTGIVEYVFLPQGDWSRFGLLDG